MRARVALAALLLGSGAAAASGGVVVVDAEGALLAGLLGVGVGKLDDGTPVPDVGLPPASLASHRFALGGCGAFLEARLAYASDAASPTGREEALLQLDVLRADGSPWASWLATGGRLHAATEEPGAAGAYEARLYHLVGGPVRYRLVLEAHADPACA